MAKIRTSINSLQGRSAKQDSDLAVKYVCATCAISYYAVKPKCPLCDLEARCGKLQDALGQLSRELAAAVEMNKRLSEQLEGSIAIRGALELLDDNDTAFLKTVLYQWKIDRTVTLRVTHGGSSTRKKIRGRARPNGFMAIYRNTAEPVAHLCTSMGGLAIAEYFEEGLDEKGHPGAMNMLVKGCSPLLPGASR